MYNKETNTLPVFINYEKGEDIADSIKYEDRLISNDNLIAISKSRRHRDSSEIIRIENADRDNTKIQLFMRKNKDDAEAKEFYFLGMMHPTGQFEEMIMPKSGQSVVEIEYGLETPIKDDLYDYIVNG